MDNPYQYKTSIPRSILTRLIVQNTSFNGDFTVLDTGGLCKQINQYLANELTDNLKKRPVRKAKLATAKGVVDEAIQWLTEPPKRAQDRRSDKD